MPRNTRHNALIVVLLSCVVPAAHAQEVPLDVGAVKAAVLSNTNAYRSSKSVSPLEENAALEAAAHAYAAYLARSGAMGHTADGGNPAKRVAAQGYKFCFISENVWSSFPKPETTLSEELAGKAMDGWKKSPGHNANLLEKRAREVGIGVAGWKQEGGAEIFRVVQVFAAPCSSKRSPEISLGARLAGALNALR